MRENFAVAHVLQMMGVFREHLGGAACQRRVYKNAGVGEAAAVDKACDVEQQFLRSFQREYRNDEITASGERSVDFGF